MGERRQSIAERDAGGFIEIVHQAPHNVVEQRALFAVEAIGTTDRQIRHPPQDVSPRTDTAIDDGGFQFVDQRLLRTMQHL